MSTPSLRLLPPLLALAALASPLAPVVPAQLAAWPAGPGTELGHEGAAGGLPSGFETSGVVWHPGRNSLVVVGDDGLVAEFPVAGATAAGPATVWPLAGDLEAIALADPASSRVLVGVENPDGVVEFDLATGQPTGAQWNLTPWMTGPVNEGLEALACVGAQCWAGLQQNGTIFRFTLGPGGAVQFLGSFASHLGRPDLAGLDYDACTGIVYAIHDTANVIVEYDASGAFLREYALAGSDQEGVALMVGSPGPATPIFIAQDTGELVRYATYPVAGCAPGVWTDLGGGTPGSNGVPTLTGSGPLQPGWPFSLDLEHAPPGAPMLVWLSLASTPQAYFGGTIHALPPVAQVLLAADAAGGFHATATWPAFLASGAHVWFQFLLKDTSASAGITLSNGLRATAP